MEQLEREVRNMLKDKAAGMPHDEVASPEFVARVTRRRRTKMAAVSGVTVLVLIAGVAAIAQSTVHKDVAPVQIKPAVNGKGCVTAGKQGGLTRYQPQASTFGSFSILGPSTYACVYSPPNENGNHADAMRLTFPGTSTLAHPSTQLSGRISLLRLAATLTDPIERAKEACEMTGGTITAGTGPWVDRCHGSDRLTLTRIDDHTLTYKEVFTTAIVWQGLISFEGANGRQRFASLDCKPGDDLTVAQCAVVIDDLASQDVLNGLPDHDIAGSETPSTITPAPHVIPAVTCKSQNTHPDQYPPDGFVPGPTNVPPANGPDGYTLFARGQIGSGKVSYSDGLAALAPTGWDCLGSVYENSSGLLDVFPSSAHDQFVWANGNFSPGKDYTGPLVEIYDDFVPHGSWMIPCQTFANSTDLRNARVDQGSTDPCMLKEGRVVTMITDRVAEFIDSDNTRGAAVLDVANGDQPGHIDVLSCRTGAGLAADACDAIIADYVARNR